jgi:flagellar protein FliO/FliZ
MQFLSPVKHAFVLALFIAIMPFTAMAANEQTSAKTEVAAAVTGAAEVTAPVQPEPLPAASANSPAATAPKLAEQPRPQSLPGAGQIVISLALVVGLVLLLAFFYKKMQLKLPGHKHFRIVATLNIGQRERLLVIEMQGKQRVLGVTAQQINFLFELETPLTEEKLASDFHTQLQSLLKK